MGFLEEYAALLRIDRAIIETLVRELLLVLDTESAKAANQNQRQGVARYITEFHGNFLSALN
jgi:hypothetical protein